MTTKKTKAKSKSQSSPKRSSAKKENDIIDYILEDHKALKKLIKVMKNSDKDIEERRAAFEEFAPLLITHAKPEEQVLYVHLKEAEDMREEALEGDVEHGLADQLLEEAMRTEDEDLFGARVKVLAELVEHHIEEEETEMLPDFRKNSDAEVRIQMGAEYLAAKGNVNSDGQEKNPSRNFHESHLTNH